MRSARAALEMPGCRHAKMMSKGARGFKKSRGNADVKYQCHGETPQSDDDPRMALK